LGEVKGEMTTRFKLSFDGSMTLAGEPMVFVTAEEISGVLDNTNLVASYKTRIPLEWRRLKSKLEDINMVSEQEILRLDAELKKNHWSLIELRCDLASLTILTEP
jgi:hypothetical protein